MIKRDPSRPGYWNVVVGVPRHLQELVKKKQLKRRIKGAKKEAELVRAELLKQLSDGFLPAARDTTLNDLIEKFLQAKKTRITERTWTDYEAVWGRYIKASLGLVSLDRLSTLAIDRHYTQLTSSGLGAATVKKVQAVMSGTLSYGVRMQLVPKNWARDVELPRVKSRKQPNTPIRPEDVGIYVQAARRETLGALLEFLLVSGARPSEAFAVLWPDLNLEHGLVEINKTLFLPKGGGWRFEQTKTVKSTRCVHLPAGLVERLRLHKDHQDRQRHFLGPEWQGDENCQFVFTNTYGGIVRLKSLQAAHKRALKAAGLQKTTVYALRATMTTLLADAGTDVKTASARLGHSDTRLTLDVYTHERNRANRGAAEALEGAIYNVVYRSQGQARLCVAPFPRVGYRVSTH